MHDEYVYESNKLGNTVAELHDPLSQFSSDAITALNT